MKTTILVGMAVLVLLAAVPNAQGLGVSPGRTTLEFEPGLEKEVTVTVINNENKDMKVAMYVKGGLESYVKLPFTAMEFKADEPTKKFTYSVKLPEKFKEPGTKRADIIIRETRQAGKGEMVVGAMVAVATQLWVKVPYPGKYCKIDLNIQEAKPGYYVTFYVPVYSLGEEDIENAQATIFIFDPDNVEIARFKTNSKPIKAKSRTELIAKWKADVEMGVYRAVAVLNYDGQTAKAENVFVVGDFFLVPLDISVKDFTLGEIAKFNILVKNTGNIRIMEALARMLLNNDLNEPVADIESKPTDFEPRETKEMIAYWDTEGVVEGEYFGKLVLSYDDKSAERRIRTRVGKDYIETEIIGVTGKVVGIEAGEVRRENSLFLIIVGLLASNAAWIVYFSIIKKRGKEKKKEKDEKEEQESREGFEEEDVSEEQTKKSSKSKE